MQYFHKQNIAHRDLKPENLFLDDSLNIKVGDFGLSNNFSESKLLKTSCGSPCYAAPEMISGKSYSGVGVDVWASGVVLYAMVCGYLPFNYSEENTSVLFREIRKGNFTVPKFISKDARHLIKSIMNIDCKTRITLEGVKRHPWFQTHENHRLELTGVVVGAELIPVDPLILSQASKDLQTSPDDLRAELLANKHNSNTSM